MEAPARRGSAERRRNWGGGAGNKQGRKATAALPLESERVSPQQRRGWSGGGGGEERPEGAGNGPPNGDAAAVAEHPKRSERTPTRPRRHAPRKAEGRPGQTRIKK